MITKFDSSYYGTADMENLGYTGTPINERCYSKAELAKAPWFAGREFTAADIIMSFPVEAANSRLGFGGDRPKLAAFLETIHARPAYQAALAKGGPYAILG